MFKFVKLKKNVDKNVDNYFFVSSVPRYKAPLQSLIFRDL